MVTLSVALGVVDCAPSGSATTVIVSAAAMDVNSVVFIPMFLSKRSGFALMIPWGQRIPRWLHADSGNAPTPPS
jgi:hypothetical protein